MKRDYGLMSFGAVCCSLPHWFKPGRAVGWSAVLNSKDGNGLVLEWEGDRQERSRLSRSIHAAISRLLAASVILMLLGKVRW